MSRDDDKRWRELYLGYEELDASRRREVDAYLARNPAARERLEKLRELERRAVEPMGAIGLDASSVDALDSEDRAGEKRSREALLARLGKQEATASRRRRGRGIASRWSRRVWLPAAVAAALLLFLGPWNDGSDPQMSGLQIVQLDDGRQTRSTSDGARLHSGDAFALSFELDREASIVVYHIDPEGQFALVVPPSVDQPPPRFDSGYVRIPGRDDPEQWVLGGDPGTEGFVVGLSAGPPPALPDLDAALQEQLLRVVNRTERLRILQSFLGDRMDAVAAVEFDHRP